MVKEEEVRRCLKSMGVNSLGIYVRNNITCIAIHCDSEKIIRDAKKFLELYLIDGEEIIL